MTTEHTSQFMTIEGLECIQTLRSCGCFHETYYATDGEIQLIRLQLCSDCFILAGLELERLDKERSAQYTLLTE